MKSLIAALFLLGMGLIAVSAQAATIDVDTTKACNEFPCDGNDNVAGCSFGEAIYTINLGFDTEACQNSSSDEYGDNDTINLPEGETLFFARHDHSDFFKGPTALPALVTSVTIHGHGSTLTRGLDPETQPTSVKPLRFFEITSNLDSDDGNYHSPNGPQIQVHWDETTFENGNPDCYCPYVVEKKKYDFLDEAELDEEDSAPLCPYNGSVCYPGGAGFVHGSGIFTTFDKTTFKNNQVRTDKAYRSPVGGAVYIDGGAYGMANFSRSLFLNNKAPAAGALYSGAGVQLSITESTFTGNKAQVERDTSNDDDLDLDPVTDALDTADSKMGGAVYAEGPISTINDSAFFANEAGVGGALALRGAMTSILNTTFFKNLAELTGGAIAAAPTPYNYRDLNGPPINYWEIYNTTPNDAYAASRDSLSYFSQFAEQSLSQFGTSPIVAIEHATIVENSVGKGSLEVSAISAGGGVANLGAGTFSLKNTILTDNTAVGGASGLNCYGTFLSLGRNDLHWPAADPSCVVLHDTAAAPDITADPALKACIEDKTIAGRASCDPESTSPMIDSAASCPVEDQHHTARSADQCTVGAIEYVKTCEDGVNHAGENCTPTQTQGSVCGNETVEEGEACDEGGANSDEPDATCRTDCTTQRCGDGIVDGKDGESCDGGVTCFECTAEVVPSDACGITREDLMDPSLKTNDDLLNRFGYDAIAKCLHVFGGGNSSCSINPASHQGSSVVSFGLLLIGMLPIVWRRKRYLAIRS